MASAVVNNVAISPEGFLPSYGWLSPRVSFSRDLSPSSAADATAAPSPETPDLEASAGEMEFIDFEFRLEDPVAMLPADELFADGKLVPLRLAAAPTPPAAAEQAANAAAVGEVGAAPELRRRAELAGPDPYVFSPKAPSCSSRWRELLGLRRSRTTPTKPDRDKPSSSPSAAASRSPNPNPNPNPNPSPGASRSLKHLLHRGAAARSGGAIEPSLSLPLLRDSDSESLSISSRLSLSSSSSSGGPDHDDLPRLSLDSDKPRASASSAPARPAPAPPRPVPHPPPRRRLLRRRSSAAAAAAAAAADDEGGVGG
ncbi:hypothetical protein ACMD2_02734 [Ananas comosus]|uniref:Uncharacterized protein n=1 Tax=Ananas comosus TaxID=4615 RepID=A0A199V3M5_ANACO|nr:hypothetical protein ACMD2_02734 [Ananas comosus]